MTGRRISAEAFDLWMTQRVQPLHNLPVSKILSSAGIVRSTMNRQQRRDDINPSSVLMVARKANLDPLRELAQFIGYSALMGPRSPLAREEVLALVSTPRLLERLLRPIGYEGERPLQIPLVTNQTWNRWLKTVNPHADQSQYVEVLGIAPSTISERNSRASWRIGQILDICEFFNLNVYSALVASGNISPQEAGFSINQFERFLNKCSLDVVSAEVGRRMNDYPDEAIHLAEKFWRSSSEYIV